MHEMDAIGVLLEGLAVGGTQPVCRFLINMALRLAQLVPPHNNVQTSDAITDTSFENRSNSQSERTQCPKPEKVGRAGVAASGAPLSW